MKIVKMNEFEEKVIELEAKGQIADNISIVIPTITRPNLPFDIKLILTDKNGMPSFDAKGNYEIIMPNDERISVEFSKNSPALAIIKDAVVEKQGFFRLEVRQDDKTFYSNPSLCTTDNIQPIYWGDIHVHTLSGNCHPDKCRSLNFGYIAQRWVSGYDFVALTDHVSNNRCNMGVWKEQRAVCDLYNKDNFVTLHAYEASFKGGKGGDNNVYLLNPTEMYIEDYDNGSIKTVCDALDKKLSKTDNDFFVVPHHTTRAIKHGEISDDIYPGVERMPAIEMHSKWGSSEYRGNPNALKQIHDGPSYAVDILNRGIKMSFVGGSDTHSTLPFSDALEHLDSDPGMTAVRSDNLSRYDIFNNIKSCNCYATSLERIYLEVNLEVSESANNRIIKICTAGKSDIKEVDIIRNGKTIYSNKPDNRWSVAFEYTDDVTDSENDSTYYYVRVTCASGAKAWSSPIWIR